jgi:DNA-directed RNA polymerase subunit RPC12/RpoP
VALNQRQWLFIVLGVLVVVVGGFYLLGSKAAPKIASNLTEDCVCLSCKVESVVSYPREEAAPHRCPKCGTQAAYPVYYCFNCKHRFVPTLVKGDPPRVPATIACPKCGTQGAMPYVQNEPMFTPTGEILLPRWP